MQRTISVIDLDAVAANIEYLKTLAGGALFFAVVKADAYGHGAERVALHAERLVDGFCVAITEEGAALRVAGVKKPVLVLTPLTSRDDACAAAFYGLTVTVNGERSARLAAGLDCHVKVNTGMNRYGCDLSRLSGTLAALKESGARVSGVYSHFYCPRDRRERERQFALFFRAADMVKERCPDAAAHISASAGTLLGGKYIMDGVRCGLAMYGYAPSGFSREGLRRALKVYARKVQTSPFVPAGAGYAVARKKYGALSAYRLGYADGFARTVALGEGDLCMDAFVSQDTAEFAEAFSDADEYAARCGTVSYEVLCSVTRRSERVYVRGREDRYDEGRTQAKI